MGIAFAVTLLTIFPLLSLLLAALTYALRDLSRVRLADALGDRGRDDLFEPTIEYAADLSFLTGAGRLICNTLILIASIELFRGLRGSPEPDWVEYLIALAVTSFLLITISLALPRAIATQYGERLIAWWIAPLHATRRALVPFTRLMHAAERLVMSTDAADQASALETESLVDEEILDAVSEGEDAGVVDDQQRELIEKVIEFRNVTVDEAMTIRQNITALPASASFSDVLHTIETTGLSRIPVYGESVDKVIGVLYSRDMLKHLGDKPETFDLSSMLRPPLYVPRTKLLRDLLNDFRLQKVHIAIVLDEYGGTAGLITIEDVVEELVGDIADEHEPLAPAMFNRIDDHTADCDARLEVQELNRIFGTRVSEEDDDFDTLGGYVIKALGRIPNAGEHFDADGTRFTVTEAVPARISRVRVQLLQQPTSPAETD